MESMGWILLSQGEEQWGCCEHYNETFGSVGCREFLDVLLKTKSAPWSYLFARFHLVDE
jgi:hypothetical protein